MANSVRIRFRSFLPGAGFDSSGNPKQGKQEVRGRIVVTTYARGGEDLTAADLGLTTVDHVALEVVDGIKSPGGNPATFAKWVESVNQFYVLQTDNAGNDIVEAGANNFTLSFSAFGDSAHDVELL